MIGIMIIKDEVSFNDIGKMEEKPKYFIFKDNVLILRTDYNPMELLDVLGIEYCLLSKE